MVMPYTSNMPLINPADVNVMPQQGLYSQQMPGMNTDVMQQAQMMPNQYPGSNQAIMDRVAAADQAKNQMDAYRMMAQGIQGMGRGMQMQMPSGNTAQIFRDQSRPQFAGYAGSPQQQMAMALRNRG